MCSMTCQYVIYHEETLKIRKARTIKLFPDQPTWDPILIEQVRSTPYDEHSGTTLKLHSKIDRRDRKIEMGSEELHSREGCASKLRTCEHLVTLLVSLGATMNYGTVQVETQKDIRTNAENASLKNSA